MDKSLDDFEEIKKHPYKIISSKYDYISIMFPQEYIKCLRVYNDYLKKELDNIKLTYKIRSRL